jgi:tetratricopeptide (TPR) repeat protein
MRYTCAGCGAEFEAEAEGPEGTKVRCPKCLRQHGLLPDALGVAQSAPAPAAAAPRSRRTVILALAAIVLLAGGAGVAIRTLHRPAAGPVLTDAALRAALGRRGVPADAVVLPFTADEGVRSLARDAAGATPLARGQAIAQAVRRLVDKSGRWRRQRLPEQPPRPAAELLSSLRAGNAGEVQSFEAAALTLAAARVAGVPALLAEVHRQGGRIADPTGTVGAFAVAVYEAPPRAGARPAGYVDAFGDGAVDDATPLADDVAAAGYYTLLSLAHSGGDGDTGAAYRSADWATKLAPGWPLALTARGQALIAGGGAREALNDLRQAAAARDDAPRHANLAAGFLAAQEPEQAEASLRTALARDAGFAPAHLALAAVLAMRRDQEGAQRELDAADRADPTAPGLRLVRAQLLAAKGDLEGAEREVRAEVAADPGDERAGLMLYGLLKALSRDSDAEAVKDALLKRTRHEARLRQVFEAAAGKGR